MPLVDLDGVAEELDLCAPDARRVARFLPEAEAYLRTLKGERWYDAVASLPTLDRPTPCSGTVDDGPPTPEPVDVRLVWDGPAAGATVATSFFVSGAASSTAGVGQVELRTTQGGLTQPWRRIAGTVVTGSETPGPPVLAWGVTLTAVDGPLVVEVRARAAGGGAAQAARAYVVEAGEAPADETGPVVVIDRPSPGGTAGDGVLVVLGRASDPAGVAGVRARVGTGAWSTVWPVPAVPFPDDYPPTDEFAGTPRPAVAWSYRVARPLGAVVAVEIEATDTLGHVGVATLAAIILPAPPPPESAGPEIVIDTPRPGATVDLAFTLTGRVTHETEIDALDYRVHYAGTSPAAWATLGPVPDGATQAAFAAGIYLGSSAPVIVDVRATAVDLTVSTLAVAVGVREVEDPPPDVPAHTLTIDRPTSGSTVEGPVVFVTGRATDAGGVASIEARVSPSTEWEELSIPADDPPRVAWAEAYTLTAGSHVVEVRATYTDGEVRTDAIAILVTHPAPTTELPFVRLDQPPTAATVQAPAMDVRGRATSATRTVAALAYRLTYAYEAPGAWVPVSIPSGQSTVVYGTAAPVAAGAGGEPGYVTLDVRATDSSGAAFTESRAVRVVQADVKTGGHLPGPSLPDDEVPVPTKDQDEWAAVPAGYESLALGAVEPGTPALAGALPPAQVDGAPAPYAAGVGPTSRERRDAERAESLLALYYALPSLNLTLAAAGGVLSNVWTRSETGTVETRFATAGALDGLRRDLLTNAKLLVDGDVRIAYDGYGDNATISSVEGWAGGAGFLGVI